MNFSGLSYPKTDGHRGCLIDFMFLGLKLRKFWIGSGLSCKLKADNFCCLSINCTLCRARQTFESIFTTLALTALM